MNGKEVSTAYFNHIIFLFIGGFIVSLAMEKWNLHKRIALKILLSVGISPSKILLGFMLTTAFLSMWISNTATAMMMVPIALSVIDSLKGILNEKSFKKYSTALLLGIAYSASVGGIATLIGTPPNLAFSQIFSISFPEAPEISFVQWMMFGIPLSLTMFIFIWLVLYIFYVPGNTFDNMVLNKLQKQYHKLGKITFEEKVVLASFILLSILWITRSPINIKLENGSINFGGWSSIFPHPEYFNDGTVAIFIGIILFLIPSKQKKREKIMDKTTMKKLPWDIILLFGGGFALAKGFVASGLSGWIIKSFSDLASVSPLIILIAIALGLSLLTEFTSNTATAQMALPLLAAISVSANINPLFLMTVDLCLPYVKTFILLV
jgi:sodium-dependent dicarboxylate transporter 2/3/5